MTYNIECLACRADEAEGEYHGYTSQNTYTRGWKHLMDLDQKLDGCVLWKDALQKQFGSVPDYHMNVTGFYRQDTMIRQISEAVQINEKGMANLMNDKTEWQLNHVPRVATV